MTLPVLSIVVPTYNQAGFIAETLAEPIRLKARGVETIVIDGGSTDGTQDILQARSDELAYWVSEKDRGQAHAINKGFEMALGRWIAFQNSDDYYLPGALETVLKTIARNPNAEVIVGGTCFVDVDGRLIRQTLPKPLLYPCFSQMNFVQNQSLFVRSDLLKRIGHLTEEAAFCLDYEWFLRIFKDRPRVALIYNYVGAQRLHEDTKTFNNQSVHDIEFAKYAAAHFTDSERLFGKLVLPFYRAFRRAYRLARPIPAAQ